MHDEVCLLCKKFYAKKLKNLNIYESPIAIVIIFYELYIY